MRFVWVKLNLNESEDTNQNHTNVLRVQAAMKLFMKINQYFKSKRLGSAKLLDIRANSTVIQYTTPPNKLCYYSC